MGMSDKQFNSWVRFLCSDIKDVLDFLKENNVENAKGKLEEIMENLDETMKD